MNVLIADDEKIVLEGLNILLTGGDCWVSRLPAVLSAVIRQ